MQNSQPESRPKVSVAMITYNHEQFIEQALDSVLMQQVNFDYEIVIGDDLSQDRTRVILLKYQEQNPYKIRLLLYEDKMGVGGNVYEVLKSCKGEYIALLEGDDYWTSPEKLQVQVDYLDLHAQCALCSHNVNIYSEYEQRYLGEERVKGGSASYRLEDLLNFNFMPRTGASVYRNYLFQLPEWIKQLSNVDYAIFLMLAHEGTTDYIDRCYGVYRIHAGGIWSGRNKIRAMLNAIELLEALSEFYNHKYDHYTKFFGFQSLHISASRMFFEDGDHGRAVFHLRQAYKNTQLTKHDIILLMKLIIFIYANPVFRVFKIFIQSTRQIRAR